MSPPERNTRREFLKIAALLVTGAAGATVASQSRFISAAFEPAAGAKHTSDGSAFELHARHIHLYSQQREKGEMPAMGDHVLVHGELFDRSTGATLGEYYSNALHLGPHSGSMGFSAATVEIHTFSLADGMLMGMGTTKESAGEPGVFAVVGGSGRFASAGGSYTARQDPQELGGDGIGRFSFRLTQSSGPPGPSR